MQVTKTAYAKALCKHGFRYYLLRGPISWFAIMFLTFTAISIFSSTPPTSYQILVNIIIALLSGCSIGILTFPIIKDRARKMEQNLSEEDIKHVKIKMERIQPFKEITGFVVSMSILCLLIGVVMSFLK
jgi:hypothetical protein